MHLCECVSFMHCFKNLTDKVRVLLNVIIGQASGGLMKSALLFTMS